MSPSIFQTSAHKFRLDGAVNSLDEHMQKIVEEFGIGNFTATFANPSIMGRTSSWIDGQGTTWAVSYAVNHADSRCDEVCVGA